MGQRYPYPVFGWKAAKLADLSFEQLTELRQCVTDDPVSANPAHAKGRSIFLYTPAARQKLDALAWAVTIKRNEQRRNEAVA